MYPDLPFLAFGKQQGKRRKKQGFFFSGEPENPWERGENTQKKIEFLARKKQGIPNKQGKEDQGSFPLF